MFYQQRTREEKIQHTKDKSKNMFSKVDKILDSMIQIYSQAQLQIKSNKNAQEVTEELYQKLTKLKPLKGTKDLFANQYRKISKMVKSTNYDGRMSNTGLSRYSKRQNSTSANANAFTIQKFNAFLDSLITKPQQISCLQELITEYYLRNGRYECAQLWPQFKEKINMKISFKECLQIKREISKGVFLSGMLWCKHNGIQLSLYSDIEYQLYKYHTISLVSLQKCEEALAFYQSNMGKYYQQKTQELQRLINFILFSGRQFWKSTVESSVKLYQILNQRISKFKINEEVLENLSKQFVKVYLCFYGVSDDDTLKTIYQCSQKSSQQYYKMMGLMVSSQKKEESLNKPIFPFSVKLDKSYSYHSIFLCPVTKQYVTSGQNIILLSCGHLISEAAFVRIQQESRIRRKIRCPICQNEVRPEQNKNVQF